MGSRKSLCPVISWLIFCGWRLWIQKTINQVGLVGPTATQMDQETVLIIAHFLSEKQHVSDMKKKNFRIIDTQDGP